MIKTRKTHTLEKEIRIYLLCQYILFGLLIRFIAIFLHT